MIYNSMPVQKMAAIPKAIPKMIFTTDFKLGGSTLIQKVSRVVNNTFHSTSWQLAR